MTSQEFDQKAREFQARGPCRIAFGITELDPGGAERALVQLVTGLDRTKWEPHVFCLSDPGVMVDPLIQADIPVTCLGAKTYRDVMIIPQMTKLLRRTQPRILQTYLFHANIIGRIAGTLAGVKTILSGIRVAERRSHLPLWVDHLTDRMVDNHVCVSKDVAEFSHKLGKIPEHKLAIIPNGVDAELFSSAKPADLGQFGIPPNAKTAIVVGRLERQKGPFVLLESLEKLLPENPDLHVLFVGSGPLQNQLQETAKTKKMENQVHFAGWRSDIPELMKAASFLVLPSRWEGMPNVILEAMSAGLPVAATEVEGTSELVDDRVTGLLVPIDNPIILAEKIEYLLSNSSHASQMGEKAQAVVSQSFTWDHVIKQYENLYLSFLMK